MNNLSIFIAKIVEQFLPVIAQLQGGGWISLRDVLFHFSSTTKTSCR